MNHATIKIRILQAQTNELHRIIEELKATSPANAAELVVACCEVRDDITAGLRVLDLAAGMIDERSA